MNLREVGHRQDTDGGPPRQRRAGRAAQGSLLLGMGASASVPPSSCFRFGTRLPATRSGMLSVTSPSSRSCRPPLVAPSMPTRAPGGSGRRSSPPTPWRVAIPGSRGYERAARHVARWLAAAGVKPIGEAGRGTSGCRWRRSPSPAHAWTSRGGRSGSCTTSPPARRQRRRHWSRARLSRLLRGRRAGRRAREAGDLPRCAAARAAD